MLKYIKHTKIQWWLTASLALTSVAMLATSCSNNDDNPAPIEQTKQRTYTANIPATIGNKSLTKSVAIEETIATGTFQTSEKIYVYNATKGTMLNGALHPSDISTDGKQCSLAGSLIGTIDAGDQLTLLYNLTNYYNDPTSCFFYYGGQNGTEGRLIDGGIATEVSATFSNDVLSCASAVVFDLTQSVFRFKFDDGSGKAINVKSLLIESSSISANYWPLYIGNEYGSSQVTVTPAAATNGYLYVSLCINKNYNTSAMNFTVTDANDNLYKGTKNAPSGGFANGKFYHNTSAISLEKQATLVKPTVTWTSVWDGQAVEPDQYRKYDVKGPYVNGRFTSSTISISGTSNGYYFYMNKGATVTLSGLTATRDDNNFIYSSNNLNLIVNGDNTITCGNFSVAIQVASGTLKISGNGTLTVTANSSVYKGLYAGNYNDDNNSDPQVLAAEGYTVTRSEMTTNGDGTYTWTYTVTDGKPKVTWTSVENGEAVEPDEYNHYYVYGPYNNGYQPSEIAISGTSIGYCFWMNKGATVTLSGLNATYDDEEDEFIYSTNNLNLVISGDNTITCSEVNAAIFVDGTLKISGDGTLTVTTNSSGLKGMYAENNYDENSNSDAQVLAADGHTVTCEEIGTNTWKYTVTPDN